MFAMDSSKATGATRGVSISLAALWVGSASAISPYMVQVLIARAFLLMLVMEWTVGLTRRVRDQETRWNSSRSR